MPPERLLLVACLYHAALALVGLLLPGDLLTFLRLDPPTLWVPWYLAAAGPAVVAWLLWTARRQPEPRRGLVYAVMVADLAGGAVLLVGTIWTELPRVLLGPAVASGLWAWLLWGVYDPEEESP